MILLWSLNLGFWSFSSHATDATSVLDSWFTAQANVHTWSADFVQKRTLKTLTQPLLTKGHITFSTPDKFRWELGQPARTIAVRSGDDMFVVYPSLKRAERYSLGQNTPKQWRDTMSLLQAGFPHDRQEFDGQFQILTLSETNGDWLLALQPKSPFARQMMPELRIGLATNDFSLASTELVFVDGSTMRSDFTNAVVNPTLDEKIIPLEPAGGFQSDQSLRPMTPEDPLQHALSALPHGGEFRFVDRLTKLRPGQTGEGEYIVRGDEPFLRGHFPGEPIFPGVLLAEAAAQLAGVVAQSDPAIPPLKNLKLAALRNVKILGTARPGEVLVIQAKITARLGNLIQAQASIRVGEHTALTAELTLSGSL